MRAAQCFGCDAGHSWFEAGGTIVVDRRKTERSGVRDATYRLDDANGYWLFPATSADVVTLAVPDGAVNPLSLSVVQVTTTEGNVKPCAVSVDLPSEKSPSDMPALDGPSVEHQAPVAHTDDPVTCDRPFAYTRVINAVAPEAPALAVQQGITGIVDILVNLDTAGQVTSAIVERSPSSLLNAAAMRSARLSRYTPTIFRCHPIASQYLFRVQFSSSVRY